MLILNDNGMLTSNEKFVFSEHQLIEKAHLYKRWFGATDEEIAAHVDSGELRAYKHYKGPINHFIWCDLGCVYYHNKQDYLNPDLYQFIDDQCDYFLLEDVKQCEAKHPEYIGNITQESFEIVQKESSNMQEEAPEYIKAHDLRKKFGMSPVQFVDYLRVNRDLCFFGNNVDESSRKWFYSHASLEQAAEMLDDFLIHHLDIDHHLAMPTTDAQVPTVGRSQNGQSVNIEAKLAEAQEEIESLRMWNKKLHEKNNSLSANLKTAKQQIVYLEAVQKEYSSQCDGKGFLPVVCRMRREGKTDEEVAAFLYGDGKFFSQAQVGALLHPEYTRVVANSMQKRAIRLLGKE